MGFRWWMTFVLLKLEQELEAQVVMQYWVLARLLVVNLMEVVELD
jgi:hypothetical protein